MVTYPRKSGRDYLNAKCRFPTPNAKKRASHFPGYYESKSHKGLRISTGILLIHCEL